MGTIVFGGLAVYLGSYAGYGGVIAVVIAFAAGTASMALGPVWLGPPGRPRPRYGWAAIGAVIGVFVVGLASALGLPNFPFVYSGVVSAFVGGFVLGLVLIRYPDASP